MGGGSQLRNREVVFGVSIVSLAARAVSSLPLASCGTNLRSFRLLAPISRARANITDEIPRERQRDRERAERADVNALRNAKCNANVRFGVSCPGNVTN